MNHSHRSRSLSLLLVGGLAWAASACGSSAPVELPISGIEPASSTADAEDRPVAEPEAESLEPAREPAPEPAPEPDSEPDSEPDAEPAPAPEPEFDEPDLVVDEDGCVTDRNLGLVIMCEDPAAGPDEGLG